MVTVNGNELVDQAATDAATDTSLTMTGLQLHTELKSIMEHKPSFKCQEV